MLKFKMAARGQLQKLNFFLKDATITKIQNGRHRATPKMFVSAKTLAKLLRFYNHIPRAMVIFFKVLLKFKMAAMDQHNFCGANTKKLKS